MNNVIFPIWFILAAIFAYLAYMQWRLSQETMRAFSFRTRDGKEPEGDPYEPLSKETVQEFNNYLEMINFRNKKFHQSAAIGFFVAVFLSLVSMFLMFGPQ
jgi:cytochrome c1